jgi:hypothetical protein
MNSITALAVARAMHADRLRSTTPRQEEEVADEPLRATRRAWTAVVSFPRFQLSNHPHSA